MAGNASIGCMLIIYTNNIMHNQKICALKRFQFPLIDIDTVHCCLRPWRLLCFVVLCPAAVGHCQIKHTSWARSSLVSCMWSRKPGTRYQRWVESVLCWACVYAEGSVEVILVQIGSSDFWVISWVQLYWPTRCQLPEVWLVRMIGIILKSSYFSRLYL